MVVMGPLSKRKTEDSGSESLGLDGIHGTPNASEVPESWKKNITYFRLHILLLDKIRHQIVRRDLNEP